MMESIEDRSDQFGERYFTDPNSGSAYGSGNYLKTLMLSRTYFEMAEIIAKVFKPVKVLEVGCAAGPTVYHLNHYFNVETFGVDVSSWAVENRVHKNVSQASVDNLPFDDEAFDVVFSCHALEHLTPDTLAPSLKELTRVTKPNGVQFHLLPIIGSGPYTDVFGSIVGLKADPTHNLLFDRQRWLDEWRSHSWSDTELRIAHIFDNTHFEFSDCQLILTRTTIDLEVAKRIADRNLSTARAFHRALIRQPPPGLEWFFNSALQDKDAELARLRASLAEAESQLAAAQQKVDAVRASTSWTVTRPLRALGTALRRQR
jgi:SAM-dependent methyltransferase